MSTFYIDPWYSIILNEPRVTKVHIFFTSEVDQQIMIC